MPKEPVHHYMVAPSQSGFCVGRGDFDRARSPAPEPHDWCAPTVELRVLDSTVSPMVMYEIWTEHTRYDFDASLQCICVRDIDSGAVHCDHVSLGTRLLAGRYKAADRVDFSAPLPALGHRAILTAADRSVITITSPVTRIIMNLYQRSSMRPQAAVG